MSLQHVTGLEDHDDDELEYEQDLENDLKPISEFEQMHQNFNYPGHRLNRFDLREPSNNEDKLIEDFVNKTRSNDQVLKDKVAKLEKTCQVQDKLIKKMMLKMQNKV